MELKIKLNLLNKELRISDKGWSSSLEFGQGLSIIRRKKTSMLRKTGKLLLLSHFSLCLFEASDFSFTYGSF
jgi:hypothetical protein